MTTTEQADKELEDLIKQEESLCETIIGKRFLSLLHTIKSDRQALKAADAELKWGHEEMRGRPPEHWLENLKIVSAALTKQDETILKLRR